MIWGYVEFSPRNIDTRWYKYALSIFIQRKWKKIYTFYWKLSYYWYIVLCGFPVCSPIISFKVTKNRLCQQNLIRSFIFEPLIDFLSLSMQFSHCSASVLKQKVKTVEAIFFFLGQQTGKSHCKMHQTGSTIDRYSLLGDPNLVSSISTSSWRNLQQQTLCTFFIEQLSCPS